MEMPFCEIADRYTILRLKIERLPDDSTIKEMYGLFQAELIKQIQALPEDRQEVVYEKVFELYEHNATTWKLEADIRQGKLDKEEKYEEIGRRTLLIRNSNKERVRVKNELSILFGQVAGLDKKVDHLSD